MRPRNGPPLAELTGSALVALLLAIYPLPPWLMPARPDWLGLFVIYWVMRAPQHVGMFSAWCLGLMFDGIVGGVLGPHALALAVTAYLALILRSRMLHYHLAQQTAVVAVLTGAGPFLAHWAQDIGGHSSVNLWFLVGSLTSASCWPIVSMRRGHGRHMEGWDATA